MRGFPREASAKLFMKGAKLFMKGAALEVGMPLSLWQSFVIHAA